jgi:hypothetical protein
MNWIKENKFIAGLIGGTLGGMLLLLFVGLHGSGNYQKAKEEYDAAAADVTSFEGAALYPTTENKDAKSKALGQYKQLVATLQSTFDAYRPKEIKNLSPQEFTDSLLAANAETRKAFSENGVGVPEAYFLGFEKYKTSLAPSETTGILGYQLASVKNLMLALAKAKVTDLRNLYRPSLPEEDKQAYAPQDDTAARSFPLEITFTGPEKSVRDFLSAVSNPANQYAVIRSMRIGSMKKESPKAEDAQFDKTADAAPEDGSGGFSLPGETGGTPATKAADTSRILSQVLGNESVQVFLRLDLLQFLPAKKLP